MTNRNEILSVFDKHRKIVFKKIDSRIKENLLYSYNLIKKEDWDALEEWEKKEWSHYGLFWKDWIDVPYEGVYDYINELNDEFWSRDEVLTNTLNARVGLDPKDIYDELTALVFSNLNEIAGINDKRIFINWNQLPWEVKS